MPSKKKSMLKSPWLFAGLAVVGYLLVTKKNSNIIGTAPATDTSTGTGTGTSGGGTGTTTATKKKETGIVAGATGVLSKLLDRFKGK